MFNDFVNFAKDAENYKAKKSCEDFQLQLRLYTVSETYFVATLHSQLYANLMLSTISVDNSKLALESSAQK